MMHNVSYQISSYYYQNILIEQSEIYLLSGKIIQYLPLMYGFFVMDQRGTMYTYIQPQLIAFTSTAAF